MEAHDLAVLFLLGELEIRTRIARHPFVRLEWNTGEEDQHPEPVLLDLLELVSAGKAREGRSSPEGASVRQVLVSLLAALT